MCAGTEGLADGEKEHGDKEMPVSLAETKDGKGQDIGNEGQNHAASAPEQIGDGTAGDFHEVYGQLPEGDEKAYLGKRKTPVQKEQDNERLKVPLVLEKTV